MLHWFWGIKGVNSQRADRIGTGSRRSGSELKMKRERFACEGTTDSGIKLFGCRIRASPEYQVPEKSGGGDRVPADYGVAPECSEIIDVGKGKARHACYSSVVRAKREVASGEDVTKIHSDFREAEATDHEQVKNFKKPDKILPCPRCNSMETKFCYFNNYNVNQPRHFCRNCQRYWTAGGTMRNVPVGAGRRKNKQLPFPFCQMVTSLTPESMPAVLKFASETSMSEYVETVLAVGDQNVSAENKEESASCGSSMTAHGVRSHSHKDGTHFERLGQPSICTDDDSSRSSGCGSVPACFVASNQLWNNNVATLGAHYIAGPMLAVPGFTPQTIPLQIVAAPYLGCISLDAASQGNVAPTALRNSSSPNCSVLGKHPRYASFDCKDTDNTIYAPRALKIDNLTDRSSLRAWTEQA